MLELAVAELATGRQQTGRYTRARFRGARARFLGECLIAKAFEQFEQWRRGSAPLASIKWLREFRAYEPAL
jgi:hypothetical protein